MEELSENTRAFWVSPSETVKRIKNPTALDLMRAVAEYKPCIFYGNGVIDEWDAMRFWSLEYLADKYRDEKVDVNFTPQGRADAVHNVDGNEYFVYPANVHLKFNDFRNMLSERDPEVAIPYLSQQDDNIRKCFPGLMKDIQPDISIANEVFGKDKIEAVNLWIGDDRSVTSIHKDFYENMFAVIAGEKSFYLWPPTDIGFLHEETFPTLEYRYSGNSECANKVRAADLSLRKSCLAESLPWIALDPEDPDVLGKYPDYKYASPVTCNVAAGEVLYIPSLWYHRVTQTQITIAVNYWYDMNFNFRYVFYESVKKQNSKSNSAQTPDP